MFCCSLNMSIILLGFTKVTPDLWLQKMLCFGNVWKYSYMPTINVIMNGHVLPTS